MVYLIMGNCCSKKKESDYVPMVAPVAPVADDADQPATDTGDTRAKVPPPPTFNRV